MMDDSRDPRFVIEEEPEKTGVPDEKQEPAAAQEPSAEQKPSAEPETSAEPEPSVQPEQPEEENPLPADFYRPTPGQSEYSYLFSEQEEIDPYDYVMEKVRSKKKNRPFPEEQPSPPLPKTSHSGTGSFSGGLPGRRKEVPAGILRRAAALGDERPAGARRDCTGRA